MKRHTITLTLFLALTLCLSGCGKKTGEAGPAGSSAAVERETMSAADRPPLLDGASKTQGGDGTAPSSAGQENREAGKKEDAAGVSASIKVYKSGGVSIEYPVLLNLTAPDGSSAAPLQEQINRQLYGYAVRVIKAYGVAADKDTLDISCKVVTADRRRITAVYTGTYIMPGGAHPLEIFYTNTVNTATGQVMGLSDYTDPYTLAGYVLSDDCRFVNADSDLQKELMQAKNQLDLDTYTDMFNRADFPYKAPEASDEEPKDTDFPQSFSFEEEGTIYVSIPVAHALGDYALIAYTPESK